MKTTIGQGINETIVSWTTDEAKNFFAYLDQVADQTENPRGEPQMEAPARGRIVRRVKPLQVFA